ncbi:fungal specific transcription factor domain-containing protein [Aspergillus mulundensis]|uniref:Xylanolytic transcriptional activator regulatory domain-containing protein n=1 Tax=Aspergillus mulundensis TaxID=1810919 RepID=A0A3D8T6C2_9EURO|nr:hypothetical protein DSM5745_01417 [Aspergillus mulundensis]RDW94095.1 hypothetical protein DSM5745_01417 [Aspergillus mulundensis]
MLFNNFTATMHHAIGILHIPSTRQLMGEAYRGLSTGKPPDLSVTMLLFAVFAVSAASPPPALLRSLEPSPEQATQAYQGYLRTARSFVENIEAVSASTTALAALTLLAYLATNGSGHGLGGHLLRSQCYWMAHTMEIHRLDGSQRRAERKANECNVIELEVQRRIWWNLVAADWLSVFSGSTPEDAYLYHPSHMCVDLPSQLDDMDITATGYRHPKPMSEPIASTFLIARAKLASNCREVVDSMPSIAPGVEPSYDTILALDARFYNCLAELPPIFQLNQDEAAQHRWARKPYIRWQRITMHLSVHTRLCRLHRPYYLKGMADPKYQYSRDVCVISAQVVLDLWHSMDEKKTNVGLTPDQFWVVAQHAFSAALTLATDVSFDASAPDAAERKAKVLAAHDILERSTDGSCGFRETIEKNLCTFMATLNWQGPSANNPTPGAPSGVIRTPSDMNASGPADIPGLTGDGEESAEMIAPWNEDWVKLWSEFLTVAPDLDFSQWDQILEGTDPHVF